MTPLARAVSDELPNDSVIRTPDQRLRVFVSSTLRELADERRSVRSAISALRLTPVMFELGARPHPPRELYRAYLAQSDIFIGLYWQSYGEFDPELQRSPLDDEFELSQALPRLLYVKSPAPDREPRLAELLSRIKQEASYRTFGTSAELGRLVRDDLATLLSERFAPTGRPAAVPTLSPTARVPRRLPAATTSLLGRERAIDELAGLVERSDVRLVTLTGPSGIGKTRLAIAAGERLRRHFDAGTVFVPLAGVGQAEMVIAAVAGAVGTEPVGAHSPLDVLTERFGDGRWLIVLDNLEHVLDAARDLDELLTRCRGAAILATSLTALRLRAEHEYPVPPLPPPPDPATAPVEELGSSPAVALFVDRARAVRRAFALTTKNAGAVAEICRRLEGLPLAIELAAARTRLLEPGTLLSRLARSLDALGTGAVDMPERQHTLRATVEWSVGLLDDDARSLLETTAVFVDGWTVESAAEVAALDVERALDLTEALAGHSLIYLEITEHGPRARMLETIREFVAERLATRPDVADVRHRHADHYRRLVEQADRPLRQSAQSDWTERVHAETGNLTAAVRWYLSHDRTPLPHLFRVLALFWIVRDYPAEAGSWIDELLRAADSFDHHARAELLWTAAVTAMATGDDAEALAAHERLAPLVNEIDDPFLHAVSELAIAWTSPIVGDFDSALQRASAALEHLRSQDEPFWTAVAAATAGLVETAVGRYDDALRHLTEVRDLAERFDSAWLTAWSRVLLGNLAVLRSRLDDASALLDQGLSLSVTAQNPPILAYCLAASARLAFARGNPEQSALLAGAAEGLRQRSGVRVWPPLRQPEVELVTQVRDALGPDRYDQVFASGTRLKQPEAVAVARAHADRLARNVRRLEEGGAR
jgi:predicted ATPase